MSFLFLILVAVFGWFLFRQKSAVLDPPVKETSFLDPDAAPSQLTGGGAGLIAPDVYEFVAPDNPTVTTTVKINQHAGKQILTERSVQEIVGRDNLTKEVMDSPGVYQLQDEKIVKGGTTFSVRDGASGAIVQGISAKQEYDPVSKTWKTVEAARITNQEGTLGDTWAAKLSYYGL